MRNFALAVIQFDSMRGRYPGYREDLDQTPAISPDDDRSWIFAVLPYMDNRAVYEASRPLPNSQISKVLDVAICKSTPLERLTSASSSYVANCGMLDVSGSADRSYDFAANGVFHNRSARNSGDVPIVTVTSQYVTSSDGLSTTLLISENADAARWTGGPVPAGSEIVPLERWMGFTWHYVDGRPGSDLAKVPREPLGLNVRTGESQRTSALGRGFARPSSYHLKIVNMAFCDGRVKAVSERMSYGVYQALMTPRGKDAMYNYEPGDDSRPVRLPSSHAARQSVRESDIK